MTHTTELNAWLLNHRDGADDARERLLEHVCDRLRILTSKMLGTFPGVKRWSETDDVLQAALLRLHRSLASVQPSSSTEFYGLAALQIRRELLDLAKHYYGPEGIGRNHHSDTGSIINGNPSNAQPNSLEDWSRFHEAVIALPDKQKQVVDLLWYEGLTQHSAADLLCVSLATVKRRWAEARVTLCNSIEDFGRIETGN